MTADLPPSADAPSSSGEPPSKAGSTRVGPRPLFSRRTRRSRALAIGVALLPWLTFLLGLIRKWQ